MHVTLARASFIIFLLLLLAVPPTFAKGKAKGQTKQSPSGWEEGEKKGWESDVPPGQEKKANRVKKRKSEHASGEASKEYHKKSEMGKKGVRKSKNEKGKKNLAN